MKKPVLGTILAMILSWPVATASQTTAPLTSSQLPKAMQLRQFPATVRSISAFRRLTTRMSMPQIIQMYGLPDQEIGSGIYIYVYQLNDGSQIHISTIDGQRIRSVVQVRSGAPNQDLINANKSPLCKDFLAQWKNKPKALKFSGCQLAKGGQTDQLIYRYTVSGRNAAATAAFLSQNFRMGKLRFICCGWESAGKHGSYQDPDGYYHDINMASDETLTKNWQRIAKFHVRVVKYLTDP
jgi:Domian of unknown function (DUF4952)